MKNKLITTFENQVMAKYKKEFPKFRAGDTVKIHYKVQEGNDASKFRIQPFEGVVIRVKKGSIDGSFTVRKMGANGIGVERVFPMISDRIEKVDLVSGGLVRRSRLFYLRNLSGKAARIKSRFIATPKSEISAKKKKKKKAKKTES